MQDADDDSSHRMIHISPFLTTARRNSRVKKTNLCSCMPCGCQTCDHKHTKSPPCINTAMHPQENSSFPSPYQCRNDFQFPFLIDLASSFNSLSCESAIPTTCFVRHTFLTSFIYPSLILSARPSFLPHLPHNPARPCTAGVQEGR